MIDIEDAVACIAEVQAQSSALKRDHFTCEDPWFSCPRSVECADERQAYPCNCGADDHNRRVNAMVLALEQVKLDMLALRAEDPRASIP